jgi:hypothetical protein
MNYDSAAWGALAFSLSTLLGVVTFFRWRAKGLAVGLRGAAWTILPVAAWLTGVLELAFDVGDSVGTWALHLVFSPVVWFGIVLTGVSVALFGASAMLRNRGVAGVHGDGAPPPVLETGRARGRKGANAAKGSAAIGDDDLGDIEAILRKHGIS